MKNSESRSVFIIGAKSIGLYGGYESFVYHLLNEHKDLKNIKYYVACKANGIGSMDIRKLPGAVRINDTEFMYCNAHCFLISVLDKLGAAQAVYYDIQALKHVCDYIETQQVLNPIVYVLASRIGPFEKEYVKRIHAMNGLVFHNPDGREDQRKKWSFLIRKYWKFSERMAVKNSDLVICDSKNIEKHIIETYSEFQPCTIYISYGAHILPSKSEDDDVNYRNWLAEHQLKDREFFVSVGRLVPENNFEVMIREFMGSKTQKPFVIITNENERYLKKLQQKTGYEKDSRIRFAGAVYDPDLLGKIRGNACAYIHGHEVGGTNPSLLEALGCTKVNLIYDVEFNREVAENAGIYWNKAEGNLSALIDEADQMSPEKAEELGKLAKKRISDHYTWEYVSEQYKELFTR